MTAQYTQEFPSATITVTKAFRIKNEEEQSVMQMKDVIRRKRKELDLTQEQMAEYLGVSAPAVNKWESGATYPDLSLVPALARLLKTDLNTLMCFHEDPTREEIAQYMNEVAEISRKNGSGPGRSQATAGR